jgi:urease subunit alpha
MIACAPMGDINASIPRRSRCITARCLALGAARHATRLTFISQAASANIPQQLNLQRHRGGERLPDGEKGGHDPQRPAE